MYDVASLINKFMVSANEDSMAQESAHEIANLIERKQIGLLEYVNALGTNLTSTDEELRVNGMHCMSSVLNSMKRDFLSKQDVSVFFEFLINKFDDVKCLPYVMKGFESLICSSNFIYGNNDNAMRLLSAVKDNYDPKKHLAKVRNGPLRVLDTLLTNNPAFFQSQEENGNLFIRSFVHIASGEKDPKNLMASFGVNTNINKTIELDPSDPVQKQLINDLFDVSFCYYPISFTPPENDPYGITSDNLKSKLNETISSQSFFANDAFTELLQKLTSTNPIIRNDVLRTIYLCVQNYNSHAIELYWSKVWDGLKFEILHNDVSTFKQDIKYIIPEDYETSIDDNDLNKSIFLSLSILSLLAERLGSSDVFPVFLDSILSEIGVHLADKKYKASKQVVLILSIISSTSQVAFNTVTNYVFSYPVFGKYMGVEGLKISAEGKHENELDIADDISLNTAAQRDLIDNIGYFLSAYYIIANSKQRSEFLSSNGLLSIKDELIIFFGQILRTTSDIEKTLKSKAVHQLFSLLSLPSYLNNYEINLVLSYGNDILKEKFSGGNNEWESDMVILTILDSLVNLTKRSSPYYSNLVVSYVEKNTLPSILAIIDSSCCGDQQLFLKKFKAVIKFCGALSVNNHLLEMLSIRILNMLPSYEVFDEIRGGIYEYTLVTLVDSVKMNQSENGFLMNSWYKNFLPRFFTIIFDKIDFADEMLRVELASQLVGLIIRYNDQKNHQEILNDFMGSFILNSPRFFNVNFDLAHKPSSYINILDSAFANIDNKCSIDFAGKTSCTVLIENLVSICHTEINEYVRLGYYQFISLLTNKFLNESEFVNTFITDQFSSFSNISSNDVEPYSLIDFEISIWMLKGLVMRLQNGSLEYLSLIVSNLSSPLNDVKRLAAMSFSIILFDLPIFSIKNSKKTLLISKVRCSNVKLLYKQRVFDSVMGALIEGYNKSNNQNDYYLLALANCFRNLPEAIIKMNVNDILPILLIGLKSTNKVVLHACLETCKMILKDSKEVFVPHLHTLIPVLVKLSAERIFDGKVLLNASSIRADSLVCLILIFSNYDQSLTFPYRESTLRNLRVVLDDNKREVRKLGADVSQILYELSK